MNRDISTYEDDDSDDETNVYGDVNVDVDSTIYKELDDIQGEGDINNEDVKIDTDVVNRDDTETVAIIEDEDKGNDDENPLEEGGEINVPEVEVITSLIGSTSKTRSRSASQTRSTSKTQSAVSKVSRSRSKSTLSSSKRGSRSSSSRERRGRVLLRTSDVESVLRGDVQSVDEEPSVNIQLQDELTRENDPHESDDQSDDTRVQAMERSNVGNFARGISSDINKDDTRGRGLSSIEDIETEEPIEELSSSGEERSRSVSSSTTSEEYEIDEFSGLPVLRDDDEWLVQTPTLPELTGIQSVYPKNDDIVLHRKKLPKRPLKKGLLLIPGYDDEKDRPNLFFKESGETTANYTFRNSLLDTMILHNYSNLSILTLSVIARMITNKARFGVEYPEACEAIIDKTLRYIEQGSKTKKR